MIFTLPAAYRAALHRGFEAFFIAFLAALVTTVTVFQSSLLTATGELNGKVAFHSALIALVAGSVKALLQFLETLKQELPPIVAQTTTTVVESTSPPAPLPSLPLPPSSTEKS